jgi:hypothetical protein
VLAVALAACAPALLPAPSPRAPVEGPRVPGPRERPVFVARVAPTVDTCRLAQTDVERERCRVEQVDGEIGNLALTADAGPIVAELRAIAARGHAVGDTVVPPLRNGLELRSWWSRGGRTAVRAWYTTEQDRLFWAAPDGLGSLGSDTDPGHALAPLLCPIADPDCGELRGALHESARFR